MAAMADSEKGPLGSAGKAVARRGRPSPYLAAFVMFFGSLILIGLILSVDGPGACEQLTAWTWRDDKASSLHKRDSTTTAAAAATPTVLENFQVAQPVLMPYGAAKSDGSGPVDTDGGTASTDACNVSLMIHIFGNSYGQPFVGDYKPPNCKFNRVVMNFTVVSQGRQFDRLALMYLGDTEVWRTSTAEPTAPPGIRWVYLKDMTEYLSLWKTPQKLIFDLGNIIDSTYTGYLNTTLTATFFQSDVVTDAAPPSDLIIPISARQGSNGGASVFMVPSANATNTVSFPRNVNRAVFSVSACGQASEEFWWSNVLQSDVYAFNSSAGSFPGYSPFREVQVLIDGHLAGVQWPYPVIFTGGVVPGLHRPIAGVDAYDLKEHEIDITPFLPLLCDGAQHTFTIRVAGIYDTGGASGQLTESVGDSWYVTGKIFVWLDDEGSVTTGEKPVFDQSPVAIRLSQSTTKDTNGTNQTLTYNTGVSRALAVTARVRTQKTSAVVSWTQSLSYSNKGYLSAYGYNQVNDLTISGSDSARGLATYRTDYRYPLFANSTYSVSPQGNISLWARVTQGKQFQVSGATVFPTGLEAFEGGVAATRGQRYAAALLATTKDGTASYYQTGDKKNSSSFGTVHQVFHFGGMKRANSFGPTPDVELYSRDVSAVNSTVIDDHEVVAGGANTHHQAKAPAGDDRHQNEAVQIPFGGGRGPRAFMGRETPDA